MGICLLVAGRYLNYFDEYKTGKEQGNLRNVEEQRDLEMYFNGSRKKVVDRVDKVMKKAYGMLVFIDCD